MRPASPDSDIEIIDPPPVVQPANENVKRKRQNTLGETQAPRRTTRSVTATGAASQAVVSEPVVSPVARPVKKKRKLTDEEKEIKAREKIEALIEKETRESERERSAQRIVPIRFSDDKFPTPKNNMIQRPPPSPPATSTAVTLRSTPIPHPSNDPEVAALKAKYALQNAAAHAAEDVPRLTAEQKGKARASGSKPAAGAPARELRSRKLQRMSLQTVSHWLFVQLALTLCPSSRRQEGHQASSYSFGGAAARQGQRR